MKVDVFLNSIIKLKISVNGILKLYFGFILAFVGLYFCVCIIVTLPVGTMP